jgi:hypothetical protein
MYYIRTQITADRGLSYPNSPISPSRPNLTPFWLFSQRINGRDEVSRVYLNLKVVGATPRLWRDVPRELPLQNLSPFTRGEFVVLNPPKSPFLRIFDIGGT